MQVNREEIINRLRSVMKKSSQTNVEWDKVTADHQISSLGFDSLSILDVIYDIQQEFNIQFDAEEVVSLKTIGDFADFIGKKI